MMCAATNRTDIPPASGVGRGASRRAHEGGASQLARATHPRSRARDMVQASNKENPGASVARRATCPGFLRHKGSTLYRRSRRFACYTVTRTSHGVSRAIPNCPGRRCSPAPPGRGTDRCLSVSRQISSDRALSPRRLRSSVHCGQSVNQSVIQLARALAARCAPGTRRASQHRTRHTVRHRASGC